MKQSKNKDGIITVLFIFCAIFILIGIGATFAYFNSSTEFENEFQTGLYQTTATETFTSPENWLPGDETPKTLTITNTGNVNVKARVCISEEWTSSNNNSLSLEQNGERMAIINLDNTSDWTKKGKCYEYNDVLEPEDVTSSFMSSVTFNPNATSGLNCVPSTSNGTTTNTCTSNGNGYDNATYKLTLRVETVQANKRDELWPDSVMCYSGGRTSIGSDSISSSCSTQTPTYIWGPFYLKHKVEYDIVTESYVEFTVTEEMAQNNTSMTAGTYLLRGAGGTNNSTNNSCNPDSPYFLTNKAALQTAFGVSNCTEYSNPTMYSCSANVGSVNYEYNSGSPVFSAYANSYGNVEVQLGNWRCQVTCAGISECVDLTL